MDEIGDAPDPWVARRVLLLALTPLWLLMLHLRWQHRLLEKGGFDPTAQWLERLSQMNPAWLVPVGFVFLAGAYWAARLRWPVPRPRAAPLDKAALAYLAVYLGAYLWMSFWAWTSPLGQQFLYSFWMLAWLRPWRAQLGWKFSKGWLRWVWAGYCLCLGGAVAYAGLVHPPPSSNPAVQLLLHAGLAERVLWMIQICLLTPLVEESWYRSLLSGPAPGRLCFSACLFGFVHADPAGLPQLIWLGLVFARVRWGAGLPAAVLTHALWNLTVFVYLLGA
ncbi:MAG: hypothetical protein KF760_16580 [Candidatus Eremiobacteraeota bacterium]|nr:hypothetical protein [Candidatus Eremiobacteraeota bacterium]MCW5867617.1 hypothetical protein [Candidatus Eremiobacteraeota bacterium]